MVASAESSSFLSSWFSGGRFRPVLRLTAGGVSVVLALTLAVTADVSQAVAAPVAAATAAAPRAEKVVSRPDVVSARVTARAQGSRVEVESLRDETSSTWVNPDGTLTTEQHQGQIRFRDTSRADGANPAGVWREVDLTMADNADGTAGPKGHPVGLSLAGAGKGAAGAAKTAAGTDLAMVRQGKGQRKQDREVTLGWGGGTLGTPVLSGTTATYREVKPGVDLVVDARRTGYETHLVITTPAALAALRTAAKSGVVSWDIPVKSKGLTARAEADGSVSFVDADGQVASSVAAPVGWDAQVDQASGNHANESPVVMTVTQKGPNRAVLTLTPDQDWLFDPTRVFPVTIDPTYASGTSTATFDTYVSSAYPTTAYSTATELRVGTYNAGGDKYRSFLTFPISAGIAGKDIISASLSLYEFHSYSCTAKPFYVYSASGGTSATTWNTQPGGGTNYGSATVAKGYSSSCAAGRVSVPITSMIQWWADSGSSAGGVRLSASETDSYGWKKFYSLESSQDPYITYTYNRKPNAATAPTSGGGLYGGVKYVAYGSTAFSSTATDPDGSTVATTIEVHTDTTGSAASLASSCSSGWVASGATATCTPAPAMPDNKQLYARAAVKDDRGLWNGTWSPWATFRTALTKPATPTVDGASPQLSCTGHPNGSWDDNVPAAAVPCTVTIPASPAGAYNQPITINAYLDGATTPTFSIATNQAAGTFAGISVPNTKGGHSVKVSLHTASTWSTNPSAVTSFGWGGAAVSLPVPGTASSGTIAVAADGPPRKAAASVTGKIQWRVAGSLNEGVGWTDGPTVNVTNAAGAVPGPDDPVQVSSAFTLSSAVQEAGAGQALNSRIPILLDVQVCFAYAGVATQQCTWSQSPRSVTRVPHAFGAGYPSADAGPGQVALYTGEFNTSATDVSVPGYSGDLALSRTHTSFDGDGTVANWPVDPVTGVFGPGWTASLQGPDAGAAGLQVIDNTRQDGTIVLVDEQGEPLVFQTPSKNRAYTVTATGAATSPYLAATTDTIAAAADLVLTNSTAAPGSTMVMTLTEEDGTLTTWSAVAYSAGADTDWVPLSVQEPGQVGKTSYVPASDGSGRVSRIIAPAPPNAAGAAAISCAPAGAMVRGCRALDLTYSDITITGNPSPVRRLTSVSATLWDPQASGGGAMVTSTVATYTYDTSGRLVSVTDPRTSLGTEYTWDGASTRLASVKTTGLAAYRLTYDATPSTPKVASVTRDNPAGSGSAVTLARYNYAAPLSGTGLPDMTSEASADQVRLWNQASNPAYGYAVFGPDYIGPISGAGVDWSQADLQYADTQGYTVNTAGYGAGAWQVTATDYDQKGNPVRELDAGATKTVRDAAGASTPLSPGQVEALSTQTLYEEVTNAAGKVIADQGTVVTDVYGPTRSAALATDLGSDGVLDVLPVRPHTQTDYDQDAPNVVSGIGTNPANGEPWRLATTITVGVAATPSQADVETTSTTVNSYAKLTAGDATEGDPWALGTPTKVTTGGITTTTRYDKEGRATETRQPLSSGSDAGTTKMVAYTAGANTVDAACGDKVEWAGLACRTFPAAAPSAGADGATTLPDSRTTAYTAWLQPLTVVETSGAVTRTTQTVYDTAGRPTTAWTTITGLTGSTSRPGTYTHYIPAGQTATGSVDYSGTLNAAQTDADPTARTATTYNAWGRPLTSTNDLGDITTTTYIAPGQPGAGSVATITENPAAAAQPDQTTAYTYDGPDAEEKTERRGLLTAQTITRAGSAGGSGTLNFAAAYDADGNLVTQKLPGQVTQTTSYDAAGEPTGLTYSGSVQPVKLRLDANGLPVTDTNGDPVYDPDGPPQTNQPWLAWTVHNDTQGRVRTETTGPAAGFDGNPGVSTPADITGYDVGQAIAYDRAYTYDAAGRPRRGPRRLTVRRAQLRLRHQRTPHQPGRCHPRRWQLRRHHRRHHHNQQLQQLRHRRPAHPRHRRGWPVCLRRDGPANHPARRRRTQPRRRGHRPRVLRRRPTQHHHPGRNQHHLRPRLQRSPSAGNNHHRWPNLNPGPALHQWRRQPRLDRRHRPPRSIDDNPVRRIHRRRPRPFPRLRRRSQPHPGHPARRRRHHRPHRSDRRHRRRRSRDRRMVRLHRIRRTPRQRRHRRSRRCRRVWVARRQATLHHRRDRRPHPDGRPALQRRHRPIHQPRPRTRRQPHRLHLPHRPHQHVRPRRPLGLEEGGTVGMATQGHDRSDRHDVRPRAGRRWLGRSRRHDGLSRVQGGSIRGERRQASEQVRSSTELHPRRSERSTSCGPEEGLNRPDPQLLEQAWRMEAKSESNPRPSGARKRWHRMAW
jgi:YD repeat-containing protein